MYTTAVEASNRNQIDQPRMFVCLAFHLTMLSLHRVRIRRRLGRFYFGRLRLFRRPLRLCPPATSVGTSSGGLTIEETSLGSTPYRGKHVSARGRRIPSSKGLVEPLLGHRKLRFVLACERAERLY
jgi:hypothetical protein